MVANWLAFMQWKIVPRMLQPTGKTNLHVNLFGEHMVMHSPVLMAPVGVQSIFHNDKETGLAQVCAETGVPYILSTASSSTIEEVAAALTRPKWYQLYWPKDHTVTKPLLSRAKSQGYKVLVITLDTWTLARRPADLDGGYIPFITGVGNQIGFQIRNSGRSLRASTGADIIKALSLGVKAVLIGRPVIYGLAIPGKKGAKQVLQGLLADLD
ncbi:FMN-linked oxidoreductase [Acephala macrosclerotiorum]|nr:FMN-linked oxidoreductase [Acephala macrosclerotiorum]